MRREVRRLRRLGRVQATPDIPVSGLDEVCGDSGVSRGIVLRLEMDGLWDNGVDTARDGEKGSLEDRPAGR
jgi:hypothetical protein